MTDSVQFVRAEEIDIEIETEEEEEITEVEAEVEKDDEDLILEGPTPDASGDDVVRSQLWYLQQGDIASCFLFASPENKAQTGPLDRFEAMIRNGYRDMLH